MFSELSADVLLPVHFRPNVELGRYPECLAPLPGVAERVLRRLQQARPLHSNRQRGRAVRFVAGVNDAGTQLAGLDISAIRDCVSGVRSDMLREGLSESVLAKSFALVRRAAQLTLGTPHYDVQLVGGWIMMHGMLAEMETGEGKSLTATLPAISAALAGIPVHVITVNDYLAVRDADAMRPLYEALGLTVGIVTQKLDAAARRRAYACDITYCTAKQVAFDYLRDRLTLGSSRDALALGLESLHAAAPRSSRLLLRGLCYAIVDEADSVLIDEARTPLLIAGPGAAHAGDELHSQALELAGQLAADEHYLIAAPDARITLTRAGQEQLARLCASLTGVLSGQRRRDELVCKALAALHVYQRDRHYLVQDGAVQIIDQHTGRAMPDRSWERGLHQMIEAKEGCQFTSPTETLARISFQRFFRRYLRLAGMTGTAQEVAGELRSVYGLEVMRVPTRVPVRRQRLRRAVFPDAGHKWQAVVDSVRSQRDRGRPVLIGTTSVADSEYLGALLAQHGIPHQVLNARHHRAEAAIVARAGTRGCVTVATNMAGRGTDIPLGPGVAQAGGLHVIVTARNEAGRIDRQLAGRCARQGDPGSFEELLALDDTLPVEHGSATLRRLARFVADAGLPLAGRLAHAVQDGAQKNAERRHRRMRHQLLHMDEQQDSRMAFAGQPE